MFWSLVINPGYLSTLIFTRNSGYTFESTPNFDQGSSDRFTQISGVKAALSKRAGWWMDHLAISALRTFLYLLTLGTNKHGWLLLKGLVFTARSNRSAGRRPHLSVVPIFENYQRFRALADHLKMKKEFNLP